MSFFNCK